MRLLKTSSSNDQEGRRTTLELHEFPNAPEAYAILSHTWGGRRDEVLFAELLRICDQDALQDDSVLVVNLAEGPGLRLTAKRGWNKIDSSLRQAWKDGYQWLWADTA